MGLLISIIYLLVKIALIWGAWWVLDMVIGMLTFIPGNVRALIHRITTVAAVIATLIVVAMWLVEAAGSIPGF